tara:strand:+ start:118 stop:723 length:606 start_codon:yes stop_codon:yes gene_type:complete
MFIKIKIFFISTLLKVVLNSLFLTCSLQSRNNKDFQSCLGKEPILLSTWHHQGLLLAHYIKKNKIPCWAISSTHPDSEILARVLTSWKINLIRGSSTRGWFNVVKKMVNLYKKNSSIIAVTPDGPRGPRKQAKTGAFTVAIKSNAIVFSVSASASKHWSLPSWDKTIIPKPFSTIYINIERVFLEEGFTREQISSSLNRNK